MAGKFMFVPLETLLEINSTKQHKFKSAERKSETLNKFMNYLLNKPSN